MITRKVEAELHQDPEQEFQMDPRQEPQPDTARVAAWMSSKDAARNYGSQSG